MLFCSLFCKRLPELAAYTGACVSYKECVDIVDMYNKGEEPEHNVAAASLQQADKAGIAGSMLVSRRGRTMRGQAHH